ncbi:MAG TPA: hypothetical protein VF744_19170 [Beijerinckiaceae bacterium]|jgi:hypothetical protein
MVERVGADGIIERSISLSPVSLVGDSPDAKAIRVAGFGLGIGQDSAVLGLYDVSAVRLDPECRIVVMPKDGVELENFRRFLNETPNLCVVKN